jgi:serine phosphatase RsbU (regulator of sigma subunit)
MDAAISERLRELPFLQHADPEVLARLAEAARERRFQPGQVILQEGAEGRELYLILDGLVEAVMLRGGEEMVLARRGPGDILGEMALLEGSPRSATVRAVEPSVLIEIAERDLRSALSANPDLLFEAARVLSSRLREADQKRIADLQRKNLELAQAYRDLQGAQAALVEKERLEHELALARDLQQSILPQSFPDLPGVSFAARSQPARQVGGDFYDVFELSEGRVGLVMADVSDKGMSAALYMALTRSLIRAEAGHHASPRRVLLSTNELLLQITQATMFVTVFYGVLNPARRELRYARAGHNYPLLFNPGTGERRLLTSPGMALGCVRDVPLEEDTVALHPGELLILYTDGITDANSTSGAFFGTERLHETVCGSGALSAQDACELVFERVGRFQARAAQYDDMAVLAVTTI